MDWKIYFILAAACIALSVHAENSHRSKRDLQLLADLKNLLVSKIFGTTNISTKKLQEGAKLYRVPGHEKILVKVIPATEVDEKEKDIIVVNPVVETEPTIALLESYLGTKTRQDTLKALEGVKLLMDSGIIVDQGVLANLLFRDVLQVSHKQFRVPAPVEVVSPFYPAMQIPLEIPNHHIQPIVITGPPKVNKVIPLPKPVHIEIEQPADKIEVIPEAPRLPPLTLQPEILIPDMTIITEPPRPTILEPVVQLPEVKLPEEKPVKPITNIPEKTGGFSYVQEHVDGSVSTYGGQDKQVNGLDLSQAVIEESYGGALQVGGRPEEKPMLQIDTDETEEIIETGNGMTVTKPLPLFIEDGKTVLRKPIIIPEAPRLSKLVVKDGFFYEQGIEGSTTYWDKTKLVPGQYPQQHQQVHYQNEFNKIPQVPQIIFDCFEEVIEKATGAKTKIVVPEAPRLPPLSYSKFPVFKQVTEKHVPTKTYGGGYSYQQENEDGSETTYQAYGPTAGKKVVYQQQAPVMVNQKAWASEFNNPYIFRENPFYYQQQYSDGSVSAYGGQYYPEVQVRPLPPQGGYWAATTAAAPEKIKKSEGIVSVSAIIQAQKNKETATTLKVTATESKSPSYVAVPKFPPTPSGYLYQQVNADDSVTNYKGDYGVSHVKIGEEKQTTTPLEVVIGQQKPPKLPVPDMATPASITGGEDQYVFLAESVNSQGTKETKVIEIPKTPIVECDDEEKFLKSFGGQSSGQVEVNPTRPNDFQPTNFYPGFPGMYPDLNSYYSGPPQSNFEEVQVNIPGQEYNKKGGYGALASVPGEKDQQYTITKTPSGNYYLSNYKRVLRPMVSDYMYKQLGDGPKFTVVNLDDRYTNKNPFYTRVPVGYERGKISDMINRNGFGEVRVNMDGSAMSTQTGNGAFQYVQEYTDASTGKPVKTFTVEPHGEVQIKTGAISTAPESEPFQYVQEFASTIRPAELNVKRYGEVHVDVDGAAIRTKSQSGSFQYVQEYTTPEPLVVEEVMTEDSLHDNPIVVSEPIYSYVQENGDSSSVSITRLRDSDVSVSTEDHHVANRGDIP